PVPRGRDPGVPVAVPDVYRDPPGRRVRDRPPSALVPHVLGGRAGLADPRRARRRAVVHRRHRGPQPELRRSRARRARAAAQRTRPPGRRDGLERRASREARRHRVDGVPGRRYRCAPRGHPRPHDESRRTSLDLARAPRRGRDAAVAVDGPRPVQARAPPDQETGVKIGIVSPYAYPRPGGANDNIRETYQNLRERGHEVRILTAPWGGDPPAQDVIQIGEAIAVPYNGSIGRITLSARLEYLMTGILDREQFDIIHHHEPFVPFLSFQLIDSAT